MTPATINLLPSASTETDGGADAGEKGGGGKGGARGIRRGGGRAKSARGAAAGGSGEAAAGTAEGAAVGAETGAEARAGAEAGAEGVGVRGDGPDGMDELDGGETVAVFNGVVSTANEGGFASVRTKPFVAPLDLSRSALTDPRTDPTTPHHASTPGGRHSANVSNPTQNSLLPPSSPPNGNVPALPPKVHLTPSPPLLATVTSQRSHPKFASSSSLVSVMRAFFVFSSWPILVAAEE